MPRLPGFYRQTSVIVEHHSGGYHNAYFTLLAEEGIFIFGFAIFVLISAFRSVGAASGDTRQDRQRRVMLLFTLIFLVLRGFIEVPGWFGYGQDPAEFSCYALLALIISGSCKARASGRSPVRVAGVSPVLLSHPRLAQ